MRQPGAARAALPMGPASMSPAQRQAIQLGKRKMLAEEMALSAPESSIALRSAPDEHTSTIEHATAMTASPPVLLYAGRPRTSNATGNLPVRAHE